MRGARSHQVVREEGTLWREAKRRGRTLSWPKDAKTQRSSNGWRHWLGASGRRGNAPVALEVVCLDQALTTNLSKALGIYFWKNVH